jgi:hypothetical protein
MGYVEVFRRARSSGHVERATQRKENVFLMRPFTSLVGVLRHWWWLLMAALVSVSAGLLFYIFLMIVSDELRAPSTSVTLGAGSTALLVPMNAIGVGVERLMHGLVFVLAYGPTSTFLLATLVIYFFFRRRVTDVIGPIVARGKGVIAKVRNAHPMMVEPFSLWVGTSTGRFAQFGHGAAAVAGGELVLELRDAAKNIVVFGETGTGKTTRVLNHLLLQAVDDGAGGLIFDIRGDVERTVASIGVITNAPVFAIGVGRAGINLLEGLTPNTAAGFLESAFKALGQGKGESGFWVSLAVTRCENALIVLQHIENEYSLSGLHRYIFDDTFRKKALQTARERAVDIVQARGENDLEVRRLKNALHYEDKTVPAYSEKERSGVTRTIETALGRFADPEIQDAFCSADRDRQAHLQDVLSGAVFVVHLSREKFKAAAQVVYLFIKERFFNLVNRRVELPRGLPARERPVLFCCDEYQQIASAGDAQFFDKSRELSTIGVVASQSLDACISAIGNEETALTLLSNFVNTIAFRSTPRTMRWITDRLGEVDIERRSYSYSVSSGMGGDSFGFSTSLQRLAVLSAQTFRELQPDQAVALLSIGGRAVDDVIVLPQLTADALLAEAQSFRPLNVTPRDSRVRAFVERGVLQTARTLSLSGTHGANLATPDASTAPPETEHPDGDVQSLLEITHSEAREGTEVTIDGLPQPCGICGGKGETEAAPCVTCHGTGTVGAPLVVRIPAGVREGGRIRLAGQGAMSATGETRGNLYLVLHLVSNDKEADEPSRAVL